MDEVFLIGKFLKWLYTQPILAFIIFSILFLSVQGVSALRPSEGTRREAAHNMLLVLVNSLIILFVFGNLGLVSNLIYEELGMPHISSEFWADLPFYIVLPVTLIVIDFANYWVHRLLHSKYFWGLHVLHHSDTHMTWTTLYRIHALEFLFMKIAFILIAGWLFLPPEIIASAAAIRIWYSQFIHCQLGWTFGKFRKVLASPNYHRWHHSVSPEAYDKNLCDMFPIWDIMFGTHYDPGLCETEVGVKDGPEGFLEGQIYPFKYLYNAIRRRLPESWVTPPQIP